LTVAQETGKKEEETNINQNRDRMLEVVASRLLQINISINLDCDDDEEDIIDDELYLIPSPIPTQPFNVLFSCSFSSWFGNACSISDGLEIVGLFRMETTNI